MCCKCGRWLSQGSFEKEAWTKAPEASSRARRREKFQKANAKANAKAKERGPGGDNMHCWVCLAVRENVGQWKFVEKIRRKKTEAAVRKAAEGEYYAKLRCAVDEAHRSMSLQGRNPARLLMRPSRRGPAESCF